MLGDVCVVALHWRSAPNAGVATTWQRHAFLLGSGATGVKTCVADILVQKTYEQRETIDWRRNFVFSSFGLCYLGAFQYVQYSIWFPRIFPGSAAFDVAKRRTPETALATTMW